MLELPESHVQSKQLWKEFQNKSVMHVEAGKSPHGFAFYNGDPLAYPALLTGKRLTGVSPNGGQIEMVFENMHLVFNDGVNVRLLTSEEREPIKHQLYIRFEDGNGIYCTIQMYGGMMAFAEGTYDNPYYLVAKEKPTPYEDAFDEAYFARLCESAKPTASVKALLATEQRIPGLGNGVLQDILFYAGINPQKKLRELKDGQLQALFKSVKETLALMRENGGRDTEKDIYGNAGGYTCVLSSKTLPYPCPRCGGGITRKAYMGGNVYFCANCQP